MPANQALIKFFGRLESAGVDKSFVRQVLLPSWWEDSIADSQPGLTYAATIVASHLGVPFKALVDESTPIAIPRNAGARFKHSKAVTKSDFAWANSVAHAVAAQIVRATKTPLKSIPDNPADIRKEILKRGHKFVSLKALLDYLWEHGIPVVHVCAKPKNQKKMAGLATRIAGRPIIVCCKNDSFSALMVFLIAHELGHVVKHLKGDGTVVDEKIDPESTDSEEKEANDFAVRLLTGRGGVYKAKGLRNLTSKQLAKACFQVSEDDGVDPGVVAMNYAWGKGFMPVGMGACKIIEGEDADACGLIRSTMMSAIHLGELSDEDQDFVRKACGCGESHAVPVGY